VRSNDGPGSTAVDRTRLAVGPKPGEFVSENVLVE